MEKEILTSKEVGELLGFHPITIHQMGNKGEIPSYKIGKGTKGRIRFLRSDIMEWVTSHRVTKFRVPKKKMEEK